MKTAHILFLLVLVGIILVVSGFYWEMTPFNFIGGFMIGFFGVEFIKEITKDK